MPALHRPPRRGAAGGPVRLQRFSCSAVAATSAIALLASNASAQTLAPSSSTPSDRAVDAPSSAIVVTGTRPYTQNLIDRKSYNVSRDLQAGSGSAADVLRNIPSVDVDAQGSVSIRGDSNVQILIDGKPSTTMSARTRADALEQLSASTIDHIEVITTPGAQFKPDASAGVINIVTKELHSAGTSGTVHANAGTDGSLGLDASATHHAGNLTLTGSVNLRRDVRWRPFTDHRLEIDPTGQQTNVDQSGIFGGPRLARTVAGTIDFDASPHDRLSTHASYTDRTGVPHIDQMNVVLDQTNVPTTQYFRHATGDEKEADSEISASYRHQFAGKDHAFTLTVRRGESVENESRLFHSFYSIPAGLQEIDEQFPRADERQQELTVEYARPVDEGKLLTGYDREQDDDDFRNRGIFIDPVTSLDTIDPTKTNRFHYRQIINAWYANYDKSLGEKLSISAGLRLESTTLVADQIDLSLRHRSTYFKAYPSAHVEYDLADRQKLRFGYGRRVVRPDPEDLDPYPVFSDPLSERAGNPDLKPEEIDALEAEYERNSKFGTFDVTGFVRRTANEFTLVSRLISPTLILTTHENLGTSTAIGIEGSDQGKVSPVISYRLSASLYRDQVNASNLGYAEQRSALIADAKAGLDLDLTKRDLLQLDANYRGKRLTAQGYRASSFVTDVGLRHTFPHNLVATLALSDLFNSRRDRIVLTTSELHEVTVRRNGGRRISLAVTAPFGRANGTSAK